MAVLKVCFADRILYWKGHNTKKQGVLSQNCITGVEFCLSALWMWQTRSPHWLVWADQIHFDRWMQVLYTRLSFPLFAFVLASAPFSGMAKLSGDLWSFSWFWCPFWTHAFSVDLWVYAPERSSCFLGLIWLTYGQDFSPSISSNKSSDGPPKFSSERANFAVRQALWL